MDTLEFEGLTAEERSSLDARGILGVCGEISERLTIHKNDVTAALIAFADAKKAELTAIYKQDHSGLYLARCSVIDAQAQLKILGESVSHLKNQKSLFQSMLNAARI